MFIKYTLLEGYKGKGKLSLYLTNKGLRHERVWGNGCIDSSILDLSIR
jgi:hypothetical protein